MAEHLSFVMDDIFTPYCLDCMPMTTHYFGVASSIFQTMNIQSDYLQILPRALARNQCFSMLIRRQIDYPELLLTTDTEVIFIRHISLGIRSRCIPSDYGTFVVLSGYAVDVWTNFLVMFKNLWNAFAIG